MKGGLRSGMHDIARSGDDARINGIRFCVVAEAFCEVTYLTRVDNGECSLVFVQQFDKQQKSLAEQILTLCARLPLNDSNQTWILATEGETSLLLGRTEAAVRFCRAALGDKTVGPVIELLSSKNTRTEVTR